jgi:hypothetical protein
LIYSKKRSKYIYIRRRRRRSCKWSLDQMACPLPINKGWGTGSWLGAFWVQELLKKKKSEKEKKKQGKR